MNIPIYKSNFEYLSDEFKCIENLVKKYLQCKENGSFDSCRNEVLKDFRADRITFKMRLKESSSEEFFAPYYLIKRYELSEFDWFGLLLAVMVKFDKNYKNLILKVEDEEELTYNAILKLYFFSKDIVEIENACDVLAVFRQKMDYLCFVGGKPIIDSRLFENIINNCQNKMNISGVSISTPDDSYSDALVVREETAVKIHDFLEKSKGNGKVSAICVHGEKGIGRKAIINRACELSNKILVHIDLEKLKNEDFKDDIISACREAYFIKGWICFYNAEKLGTERQNLLNIAVSTAFRFCSAVFILSDKKTSFFESLQGVDVINVNLPELTMDERFKLWKDVLSGENIDKSLDISELSGKFTLNPKQITQSVCESKLKVVMEKKEKIDRDILYSSIYSQMTDDLSDKATLIRKKHTWNELILNPSEKEIIKRACDQLRYRRTVYEKWKMGNRILYGTGLSMLFAGPSGTGKTMAAQVVAQDLGLEIYKVDLSRVISKYIGESEKNLGEIFDRAKKSNVILLFDETDSIFAKRTEVKDSHDRNANLETSYLLQKMEEHTGVTILTTNFLENIDKAFFRRINYVVHFAFPNVSARKEIWQKMFNSSVPMDKDIDFNFIARQFELSGGSIKNASLTAAFMAASENKKISMKHMIKAIEYEIRKQGKMVSKADFGEYGYLL